MKPINLIKRTMAGILLTWGFICAVRVVDVALDSRIDPVERRGIIVACLMLGTPALWGGNRLWRQVDRQQAQQQRDRTRILFFQLLQQGQGYIAVLPFAMQTGLSAQEAQAFLDARARDFQADYQVSDTGQIFYYFDLSGMQPHMLPQTTPGDSRS
jgi:hypothetical protein